MRSPPRRLVVLCGLAALVGFLAGGAAFVLVHGIGFLTNVVLFGRIGWELPSFVDLAPSWRLVIVPMVGALIVIALARWSPIIRGHGIPEAMEAILRRQSRIAPRAALAKPLSAAIAIGTGGPFGAEGPIIVTGGALGSLLGQAVDVSPSERKILLASGAAAGMAATFGAPLASVVIAIELLLFEFSTRAFIPVAIAASIAAGIHSAIFGSGPLFHVPPHAYAGLDKLPFYAVLGVASGLLATVIAKGLFFFEELFRRLPIRETWHPLVGALGFGIVGLVVPRALGVGYDAIDDVLAGHLALGALVALFVAKLLAWWIALASGTSGGTLAPVLLVSGAFGGVAGALADRYVPGLGVTPGAAAVVAMAATFGAATRATFTSIVFLFELTRDYHVILPLMLASVLADLVALPLLRHSLMTEKLARRGIRVEADLQVDSLGMTTVAEVMTRSVVTLRADATHADALGLFERSGHSAYPIVDADNRCVGMVSRRHLLLRAPDPMSPILVPPHKDVVGIAPGDTVMDALLRMAEENVDHLPVLESGRLVGICTRTDVLRVHTRAAAADLTEGGWLTRARSRPSRKPTPRRDAS